MAAEQKHPLRSLDVRGQLLARIYTTLSSELAGKIASITVKDGDRFATGVELISLDCTVQQAQLNEAIATLGAASNIQKVNRRLRQLNSAAELELEMSIAEEAKAQARVDAMVAVLSKCKIPAPFSGRVAELKVQPLQYVQAGQPVLDLVDDTGFDVEFLAPSQWLGWLKLGLSFRILIDEMSRSYEATVIRIGARVDPVSQTVKVYGQIIDHAPELVTGMSGKVRFELGADPL